ncbi:MAG: hypothetical protein E7311_00495 [Clostridiales bacterium]|nr:hypothetical protein [Clostridiales bacterium]
MEELENVQENEVTNVVEETQETVENVEVKEEIKEEVKEEKVDNAPVATEKVEGPIKRFFKKFWAILKMEV